LRAEAGSVSNILRFRILLDFAAVGLFIACLAYWWLDNLSHELFGTFLFALIIVHNVFNRRWYGKIAQSASDLPRLINAVMIISLAIGMIIMLATSLMISRDLFRFTAVGGAFAVREIHMFAAYWVLLIMAVHLGTRWQVVMNVARGFVGMKQPSRLRSVFLRLIAVVIAAWGIKSSSDMAFGSKLMLTYSLDMWDFNESTIGFFLNYGSIVGLYAVLAHYALIALRRMRRNTPARR
jgi:hypothetical protein